MRLCETLYDVYTNLGNSKPHRTVPVPFQSKRLMITLKPYLGIQKPTVLRVLPSN